jgi:hypothetical protein
MVSAGEQHLFVFERGPIRRASRTDPLARQPLQGTCQAPERPGFAHAQVASQGQFTPAAAHDRLPRWSVLEEVPRSTMSSKDLVFALHLVPGGTRMSLPVQKARAKAAGR